MVTGIKSKSGFLDDEPPSSVDKFFVDKTVYCKKLVKNIKKYFFLVDI